jgi:hypothetical protein
MNNDPAIQPNDQIEIQRPHVPVEVFRSSATAIEYTLTELITDIALADTYVGDDAINHIVGLLSTAHTLQEYLFVTYDELLKVKKFGISRSKPNL